MFNTMYNSLIGLHFTTRHTGKMEGMYSLSTSCKINPNCKKFAEVKGSICSKCYAQTMLIRYNSLEKNLFENTHILTTTLINKNDIPFINASFFRFEAFGDLHNEIQFINYMNIARYNPHCNFAIWTKNPEIMKKAFEMGYKKPKNLIIIGSSLMINIKSDFSKYDFIDKTFTVYDNNAIQENNININCGARSCINCLKCYKKNGINEISEKLK